MWGITNLTWQDLTERATNDSTKIYVLGFSLSYHWIGIFFHLFYFCFCCLLKFMSSCDFFATFVFFNLQNIDSSPAKAGKDDKVIFFLVLYILKILNLNFKVVKMLFLNIYLTL